MRNVSRYNRGARKAGDLPLLAYAVECRCDMEPAKLSAMVNLQGSQLTVKTPGVFMDEENAEVETKY